jgi:hypothetical protein
MASDDSVGKDSILLDARLLVVEAILPASTHLEGTITMVWGKIDSPTSPIPRLHLLVKCVLPNTPLNSYVPQPEITTNSYNITIRLFSDETDTTEDDSILENIKARMSSDRSQLADMMSKTGLLRMDCGGMRVVGVKVWPGKKAVDVQIEGRGPNAKPCALLERQSCIYSMLVSFKPYQCLELCDLSYVAD